jgi:tRNA splicing endonuclease
MDSSTSNSSDSRDVIRIVHFRPFTFFCFSAVDVKTLRKSHRIIGQCVAQLPSENLAPKALSLQGLPLLLSPYEAYIGIKQGFIRLVANVVNKHDETEAPKSRLLEKQTIILTARNQDHFYTYSDVDAEELFSSFFDDPEHGQKRSLIFKSFEHFWRNGYVVQTSSHFHTDLVVYTADPLLVHASFLVICVPWKEKMRIRDLMTYARLASSVKKTLLIVSIGEFEQVTLVEFKWAGIS